MRPPDDCTVKSASSAATASTAMPSPSSLFLFLFDAKREEGACRKSQSAPKASYGREEEEAAGVAAAYTGRAPSKERAEPELEGITRRFNAVDEGLPRGEAREDPLLPAELHISRSLRNEKRKEFSLPTFAPCSVEISLG